MVEFVCQVDDIVGAHQRVTAMNFIPMGYKMPTAVQEACAEAENQVLASGAGEIETEPPSPAYNDESHDAQHDDDLPPSPAEEDSLSHLQNKTSSHHLKMRTALPHLQMMTSLPHVQMRFII